MEKRKEKEKKINILSEYDKEALTVAVDKLNSIKEGDKITENTLQELEGICTDLTSMKDRHCKYLIRWIKQDYVLT